MDLNECEHFLRANLDIVDIDLRGIHVGSDLSLNGPKDILGSTQEITNFTFDQASICIIFYIQPDVGYF